MKQSLLYRLSIHASLILTYSCTDSSKSTDSNRGGTGTTSLATATSTDLNTTPNSTNTTTTTSPTNMNACVLNEKGRKEAKVFCTDELIATHSGKADGFQCLFEVCALPPSGNCSSQYHEPAVVSKAPNNKICDFQNPIEL